MNHTLATARTWAEINVDDLLYNYKSALAELSPGVQHFTVLKANAYGLGGIPVSKILYRAGARLFAVACTAEGCEMRRALPPDAEILVMGATAPVEREMALRHALITTVFDLDTAQALSALALEMGVTARVHVKVNTGLNRLGFSVEEAPDAVARIAALPGLHFEGLFSHLQRRSPAHDVLQGERLVSVRDALAARGVAVPMLHLLDSIGMWRYPGMQYDAVRDAAFVIGHTPPDYPRPERMRFALSFKTRVVHVQWVEAGECMGYDADHPLKQRARVATLCVGYGDGYPRAMSHRGQVEIRGRRAPVVGVVCMDLTMVDVTDIPETAVGDEVTLLGGGISIESYAAFSDGYKNEYITIISRRVPRVYIEGGQVIDVEEYLGYA